MNAAVLALWVIGAGAAGTLVRYLVTVAATPNPARTTRQGFPWVVLIVNVVGSAIAGAALAAPVADPTATLFGIPFIAETQLIVLTGFCGGLTTFSTFSVETIQLVLKKRIRTALLSVTANLALGIGSCALAYLAVIALWC